MFWGMVYPTLAVLPQIRERLSGRIVNITSIGGKVSVPHLRPYSSAKFAAVGFSEGLSAELARDGIRVTSIVPGLMRTGGPGAAALSPARHADHPGPHRGAALSAHRSTYRSRMGIEKLRKKTRSPQTDCVSFC
jgi:short-subunit dehydrogenase